ncbi:hypothetical protein [Methyloceanibacter sp.]|jgi:magnesium-transporting ATPase (P-type)|uniref:hypothetical protein n=1 Tax=Methyloceanibacter sp. TaxID=1965321 RepID=UPI00356989CC
MTEASEAKHVSTWRKVLAAILDFFTIFFIGGYIVGYFTGNITAEGFQLQGMSALILFVVIIAYFVIFMQFLGGTLWQRLLKAR